MRRASFILTQDILHYIKIILLFYINLIMKSFSNSIRLSLYTHVLKTYEVNEMFLNLKHGIVAWLFRFDQSSFVFLYDLIIPRYPFRIGT